MQILYGVPVPQGAVPRLVALANSLEDKCIGVIVDNLDAFTRFHDKLVAHLEYKSDIKVEGIRIYTIKNMCFSRHHRATFQACTRMVWNHTSKM